MDSTTTSHDYPPSVSPAPAGPPTAYPSTVNLSTATLAPVIPETHPTAAQFWAENSNVIAQNGYKLHQRATYRTSTEQQWQAADGSLELATKPGTTPPLPRTSIGSGDQRLLVFPRLHAFNVDQIKTFWEFDTFFTQICKGIQHIHTTNHNVANRDWTADNIRVMVDPSGMGQPGYPASISRIKALGILINRVFRT
ncbi:hypothetical protein BJY52DRAFT_1419952, partial [Lactarius psammicola]